MEAVARQFAAGTSALIIRNGLFSFRWTAILDAAGIAGAQTVLKARPVSAEHRAPWVPAPVEEVTAAMACTVNSRHGHFMRIMEAYENGGHAYYATLPTDSLRTFRDAIKELEAMGQEIARDRQIELGSRVRSLLGERAIASVAAPGYEAPGVVVSYARSDDIRTGKAFAAAGLQVAAGVPLNCDEPQDFSTFRIGLFGLDKLQNVDRTVQYLRDALDRIGV